MVTSVIQQLKQLCRPDQKINIITEQYRTEIIKRFSIQIKDILYDEKYNVKKDLESELNNLKVVLNRKSALAKLEKANLTKEEIEAIGLKTNY